MTFKETSCLLRLATVAILLYLIIIETYMYVILILVAYCGYRFVIRSSECKIEVSGKVIVITGCDTGFGHHAAIRLEALGFTVVAGCLLPEGEGARELHANNRERLHVVHLDVTKDDCVTHTVMYVQEHCTVSGDTMWALINNAGIYSVGDLELVSLDVIKQVAEVNYFGMVRTTKAFLPLIRKSQGRVVNVTSVRGLVALPMETIYTPTKWAAEAFSDILRREMFRFGVKVVIIEPGNYGGATGILNEENLERMVKASDRAWAEATPEVRSAYGDDYRQKCLQGLRDFYKTTYPNHEPVLVAIENAVTNVTPRYRQLVPGSSKMLDFHCVFAVLSFYLPDYLMDYVIRVIDPLPPVAQQVKT